MPISNFDQDNFDGQLTIKAPHARLPNIKDDNSIEDKVLIIFFIMKLTLC